MDKRTRKEISDSMVEVRKAYRLLHTFQKRILDLANYIGHYWDFGFHSGHPWFSDAVFQRKNAKLDRWSWDWLPMYYYDLFFEKEVNGKKLQLGVIIQADTGYYDVDTKNKNDVLSFGPPENSETRIILMASDGHWNSEDFRKNGYSSKETTEYPVGDIIKNDKGKYVIAKAYSIENFINEDLTKEQLVDFESFCESKGIDLQP